MSKKIKCLLKYSKTRFFISFTNFFFFEFSLFRGVVTGVEGFNLYTNNIIIVTAARYALGYLVVSVSIWCSKNLPLQHSFFSFFMSENLQTTCCRCRSSSSRRRCWPALRSSSSSTSSSCTSLVGIPPHL